MLKLEELVFVSLISLVILGRLSDAIEILCIRQTLFKSQLVV